MTTKPLRRRPVAVEDAGGAVDYYLAEAGPTTAARFYEALGDAMQVISRNPRAGSGRLAELSGVAGLRTWRVRGFPYLVCYVEQPDHIDIWRILHGARDLGQVLDETPETGD